MELEAGISPARRVHDTPELLELILLLFDDSPSDDEDDDHVPCPETPFPERSFTLASNRCLDVYIRSRYQTIDWEVYEKLKRDNWIGSKCCDAVRRIVVYDDVRGTCKKKDAVFNPTSMREARLKCPNLREVFSHGPLISPMDRIRVGFPAGAIGGFRTLDWEHKVDLFSDIQRQKPWTPPKWRGWNINITFDVTARKDFRTGRYCDFAQARATFLERSLKYQETGSITRVEVSGFTLTLKDIENLVKSDGGRADEGAPRHLSELHVMVEPMNVARLQRWAMLGSNLTGLTLRTFDRGKYAPPGSGRPLISLTDMGDLFDIVEQSFPNLSDFGISLDANHGVDRELVTDAMIPIPPARSTRPRLSRVTLFLHAEQALKKDVYPEFPILSIARHLMSLCLPDVSVRICLDSFHRGHQAEFINMSRVPTSVVRYFVSQSPQTTEYIRNMDFEDYRYSGESIPILITLYDALPDGRLPDRRLRNALDDYEAAEAVVEEFRHFYDGYSALIGHHRSLRQEKNELLRTHVEHLRAALSTLFSDSDVFIDDFNGSMPDITTTSLASLRVTAGKTVEKFRIQLDDKKRDAEAALAVFEEEGLEVDEIDWPKEIDPFEDCPEVVLEAAKFEKLEATMGRLLEARDEMKIEATMQLVKGEKRVQRIKALL